MPEKPLLSGRAEIVAGEKSRLRFRDILIDVKYLIKGKVLPANVFPAFTAYWLALYFSGETFLENFPLFIHAILGSTLVISGALIINNWYEADLDAKMERTKRRPTVTGHFSLRLVLWLGILSSIAGFLMVAMTRAEALIYSFIGWFVYVVLYTFWTKRRYTLNTIVGAISGMVTPLIGWGAVMSTDHIVPWALALILFIWQIPHTLAITVKRYEEYKAARVPMLPIVCGIPVTKRVNFVYVLALVPLSFLLLPSLGWGVFLFKIIAGLVWIPLAAWGFRTRDDKKWAQANLIYSLNYLNLSYAVMILATSNLI